MRLIGYRLFHQGRHHWFEDKTEVEALAELIWMPGHPLEFQARLDGGKGPEFKGLANAQAQGKGDLVFAVGPPVHHDVEGKAHLPGVGFFSVWPLCIPLKFVDS